MKKIFAILILLFGFCTFANAQMLKGEIRKEIKQQNTHKEDTVVKEIEEAQPNYSTGAILAYNAGIEYFNNQMYDKAIESFNSAVKQDYRFTDAYFNLGVIYEYFDNTPNALIAFHRAYLTNKKDDEALFYVVKCYILLNDRLSAKQYAKKINKKSIFYDMAKELLG